MNASFTGTKDSTSAQSAGTSVLTPDIYNHLQGSIGTVSLWPPSMQTSTIKNWVSESTSRHCKIFLHMTSMRNSQSHSAARGGKLMRTTSLT